MGTKSELELAEIEYENMKVLLSAACSAYWRSYNRLRSLKKSAPAMLEPNPNQLLMFEYGEEED